MCGIAGVLGGEAKTSDEAVRRMVGHLVHRGPDGTSCISGTDYAFGHARLAVVDLVTGAQPMRDDVSIVTFNGEIFGYEKLRKELSSYPFKTSSDTEVILALYARYENDFVSHLPGQFAFALWDEKKKTLLCARDRFGEKPFYYAYGPQGEFLFASELKSLLASNLIRPVIDRDSLAHYMKHNYVHPTKTIYKNVFTLPAAHYLTVRDGIASCERYWKIPDTNSTISIEDATEKLQELLDTSVRDQLVADVPVGAFLSGGVDSSTIVALASRHTRKIKTFSFRFGEDRDETPFAREIAKRYETDHTELTAKPHELVELIQSMATTYDEPFADSSNIPTSLLSEAAREHVTVALTGDGGDELFGGYTRWYRPLLAMQEMKYRPSLARVATLYLAARVLRSDQARGAYLGARFKNRFPSLAAAHENQDVAFPDDVLRELFPNYTPPHFEKTTGQSLDDVMREDIANYMPGDILVKVDRASMAHGLELRAPYLGKEFAEFAIALPWQMKITDTEDKYIFKKAFADLLTDSVRTRPKQGFGAPVRAWLSDPAVARLKEEYLNNPDSKVFKLISFEKSRPYIETNDQRTWNLLTLALWADTHEYDL